MQDKEIQITTVKPYVPAQYDAHAYELNRMNGYIQEAKKKADTQVESFNKELIGVAMFKSWKTTLAGISAILGGIVLIVVEGKVSEGAAAIIAGIGLLFAQDIGVPNDGK